MLVLEYNPADADNVVQAHKIVVHSLECNKCRIRHETKYAFDTGRMFGFINSLVGTLDERGNFVPGTAVKLCDWESALRVLEKWMLAHTVNSIIMPLIEGVDDMIEAIDEVNHEHPTVH